jgi:hypothetical protein
MDLVIKKKTSPLKWLYFTSCVLYISGATYWVEIDWLFIPIALLGLFIFTLQGCKWDRFIIYIFIAFVLLNMFSVLVNGSKFYFNAFAGYFFRIIIPYFLIKIFNDDFFVYYEKLIYFAALISLPLLLFEAYDRHFFMRYFADINMSNEERTSVGYWNFFIYTTHGAGKFRPIPLRNDGFAVEPGHFGYLLGIAIFYNLVNYNFKFNVRLLVMMLAGITTFSTTFYLTLILFLIFYYLNFKVNIGVRIATLLVAVSVNIYLFTSSIGMEKIERTSEITENQFRYGTEDIKKGASLNRFGAMKMAIINLKGYPMGYGMNEKGRAIARDGEIITGPNGVATFMTVWGIPGLIFLIFSQFRFVKKLKEKYPAYRGLFLFSLIFLLFMFSNSISRDILVFIILMYPFIRIESNYVIIKDYYKEPQPVTA